MISVVDNEELPSVHKADYERDFVDWAETTAQLLEQKRFSDLDLVTGQCEVFQKISFLYELKPLQALTYTTCKPGPDENHSQTLKPLSDGHSLKNFALSS